MMDQPVSFIGLDSKEVLRLVPDAYRVREERPAVWLQRLCCWVLHKLGAVHDFPEMQYTRIDVDKGAFMDRIFKQKISLDYVYHYKPERLLIGAEDYQELMGGPEIRSMLTFDAGINVRDRNYTHVMGLRVTVVPWMRGLLVMPRGE